MLEWLNQRSTPEQIAEREANWAQKEAEKAEELKESARVHAAERASFCDSSSLRALRRAPPAVAALIGSPAFQRDVLGVNIARKWARGEQRGLVLRGGVGTGKTVAAACAMAEHTQVRGYSVSWHRPNDFVSGMLHKYDDKAPVIGSDLVVIDDLGRETKGDFEEALVVLIDDHLTRFVLTTNLTMEELRARYGERLIDRLDHECTYLAMAGKSQRRNP
jgi:predicted ATPase